MKSSKTAPLYQSFPLFLSIGYDFSKIFTRKFRQVVFNVTLVNYWARVYTETDEETKIDGPFLI